MREICLTVAAPELSQVLPRKNLQARSKLNFKKSPERSSSVDDPLGLYQSRNPRSSQSRGYLPPHCLESKLSPSSSILQIQMQQI